MIMDSEKFIWKKAGFKDLIFSCVWTVLFDSIEKVFFVYDNFIKIERKNSTSKSDTMYNKEGIHNIFTYTY